jgi:hypothetical protein
LSLAATFPKSAGVQNAPYDWSRELDHFVVDKVIVKPDVPLATELKTWPGGGMLFGDGKADSTPGDAVEDAKT